MNTPTVRALIARALLIVALVPLFAGCETEDELVPMLVGKTWKMSRLTTKGSDKQFCLEWDTDEDYQTSMAYFAVSSYYVISFDGAIIDDELVGNEVSLRGVDCSATGTWYGDGSTHEMSFDLSLSGTETDPLAVLFIEGLQSVYSYSGDTNNLNLYFKDGTTTYVIGFTPR